MCHLEHGLVMGLAVNGWYSMILEGFSDLNDPLIP